MGLGLGLGFGAPPLTIAVTKAALIGLLVTST